MDKKNDNAPKLFSFAAGSNLNTPTFSESKPIGFLTETTTYIMSS